MGVSRSRLRVLFLTLYPDTMPSSRLRVYQYLPHLASFEIDAEVWPSLPEPWFSRFYSSSSNLIRFTQCAAEFLNNLVRVMQARRANVVFIQKGISSANLLGFDSLLQRLEVPFIFDFDDDILGKNIVEFQNPFLRRFQDARQTIKLVTQASTVIAGNSYLKEQALPYNPNIFVIPTPVDTDRFCPRAESREKKETVIGWIGMEIGLANLRLLANVLEQLAQRYPIRLKIISRLTKGGTFQIPGVRVDFVDWSYQNEVSEMSDFDIGLMPLKDDEWVRGKCGLKLLQYMAMGIPSVASRAGANCEIVDDGVDGYLAGNETEWFDRLSTLIQNYELRKTMGIVARRKVEKSYSLKATIPSLVHVLKKVGRIEAAPAENVCVSEPIPS